MSDHFVAAALLVALIAGGVICTWLVTTILALLGLPDVIAVAAPAVYLAYRFCLWVVRAKP